MKELVHAYFLTLSQERVDALHKRLLDLKETASAETKSTAGDKHETALAMVQLEQETIRTQYNKALAQLAILQRLIADDKPTPVVILGSLVKTTTAWFYISTALGKASINQQTVFALSAESPLGLMLMNKRQGDSFTFNATHYTVLAIY